MKFSESTVWKIDYKDETWLDCCVRTLFGHDFDLFEAIFLTREGVIELIKTIFYEYEKQGDSFITDCSYPSEENIKKILTEIGSSSWTKTEYRFSPSIPSEILTEPNMIIMKRSVEMRAGINICEKKTAIIDGVEYSRVDNHTVWSQWYPSKKEDYDSEFDYDSVYLIIREHRHFVFE
jgi:hypothetical protein